MRRTLVLLPFLLLGCRPSRLAAVSNDGRVASTAEGGTYVAGRGKVAEGGSGLVWSADGQTLAIAARGGVVLWPKGERIAGLEPPLAFSPFGDRLAGMEGKAVRVHDLATSARTAPAIEGTPTTLRWTPDGRLFGFDGTGIQVDGGPRLALNTGRVIDAVPLANGKIALVAWETMPKTVGGMLKASTRWGTWDLATGGLDLLPFARVESMFGTPSPRRLALPTTLVLAPDGRHVVAAGVRIETGPRNVARLKALAAKPKLTPAEDKEADAILKAARTTNLVVRLDPSGRSDTLWSDPTTRPEWARVDLAFSPDGKWLVVARKDGSVRIAVGP